MYSNERNGENDNALLKNILYFKVVVSICLLALGGYVAVWAINVLELIIKNSSDIPLINSLITSQDSRHIIEITMNNERIIAQSSGVLRVVFVALLFMILFNVIGRIISGIFSCLASVLSNLSIKENTKTTNGKSV